MAIIPYLNMKTIGLLVSAAALVNTAPTTTNTTLQSRGQVISHNDVVGFKDNTVPDGYFGELYKAYKPFLKVRNGCVPFPAVDSDGNTSGGLKETGAPEGGCSKNIGQVYVRGGSFGPKYGLMYAWYFPKDEVSNGIGHRHDWEGVVVWLKDATKTDSDNIAAVCPSAHGGWECETENFYVAPDTAGVTIDYNSFFNTHECGITNEVGGQQPLVAWESLTPAAQVALDNTDFGHGVVPFKDVKFQQVMEGDALY